MKNKSRGRVVWITGLSGAGKSTLAKYVVDEIKEHSNNPVVLLDGDELRMIFGGLNFDSNKEYGRDARVKLAMAYAGLCRLLSQQGIIVVIATISLFKEIHSWNRMNIPGYYEIFLDVPIDELIKEIQSLYIEIILKDW